MLVANILATLEQASFSKANMTVQSINGTPSLILSFMADGATATDSHEIMKLRKALAQPLVVTGPDLEQQLVSHLGHSVDELISVITDLKKAQNATTNTKPNKNAKAASVNRASTPKSAARTTSQEAVQTENVSDVEGETTQKAEQQVSQVSISDFSL